MADEALATASVPSVGAGTSAAVAEPSPSSDYGSPTDAPGADTATSDAATGTNAVETDPVDSPEGVQDGRIVPQEFRELFKANPKLKNVFYSERAFRQEFPTVQEARKAKEFIETVGGEEGWQAIQDGQAKQQEIDGLYASRDPQKQRDFVKHLLTQDKAAFRAIVPVALAEFHQADPQTYNRVMSQIIANTFAGSGVANHLAQIKQALRSSPEQAEKLLDGLGAWVSDFEKVAQSKPEVDPDREAFEQEKAEWQKSQEKQKSESFSNSYRSEAGTLAQSATEKHLKALLSGKAIDKESMDLLVRNVFQEVAGMATQDEVYKRQMNGFVSRRDQARAVRAFTAKFNQLLPEAAKKVYRVFSLGASPKTAPAQNTPARGTTPTPAGMVQVMRPPKPGEVDRSRTTDSMIMQGHAWLRDGKHVKWE